MTAQNLKEKKAKMHKVMLQQKQQHLIIQQEIKQQKRNMMQKQIQKQNRNGIMIKADKQ